MTQFVQLPRIAVAEKLKFLAGSWTSRGGTVLLEATFDLPLNALFRGEINLDNDVDLANRWAQKERNASLVFAVTRQQLAECAEQPAKPTWAGKLRYDDYVKVVGSDGLFAHVRVEVNQLLPGTPLDDSVADGFRIVVGSLCSPNEVLGRQAA